MSTIRETASRRVTPWGVVGIILVPLIVAGLLIFALWNPQDRLKNVTAAIVNNDVPVEINGQTVPLGRQLSAELVGGDTETNYTWVLTDEKNASAGLNDGSYVATVTLPKNFSEAATSFSGDAADAVQAQIDVTTSDKSRLVDDALTQAITSTAATLLGQQLTTTYLENIYVGFNTLNDSLGTAADGADQLADGAVSLADGAAKLNTGVGELATGAGTLADGATQLSGGISALSGGATQLSSGASTLASNLGQFTGGVTALVGGLNSLNQQAGALPDAARGLAGQTAGVVTSAEGVVSSLTTTEQNLRATAVAECATAPGSATCTALTEAADSVASQITSARGTSGAAQQANGTAQVLAGNAPQISGGLPALAAGINQITTGAAPLAAGAPQLADGANQLASGAAGLASGTTQLATGGQGLAAGASALATGTGALATGTSGLADGSASLADGTGSLASGLGEAVEQIPTYPENDRDQLAKVVADPVSTSGSTTVGFGASSLPLYAVLALWIGAFATFIVLSARPARALGSTKSSLLLTLRSFALPGIIGVVQGALVAVVLGTAQNLASDQWVAFAALSVVGGIAFAAVNQALVAWLGGFGRFVSMIIALVVLATGVVSTAPAALDAVRNVLPVQPLINGMQLVLAGQAGVGGAIMGLVGWTLLALGATTLAVARKRMVTTKQLALAAA